MRATRSRCVNWGASALWCVSTSWNPARCRWWMVYTSWLVLASVRKRLEEWPCPTNRLCWFHPVCQRVSNCRQQPLSTCRRIDHRATTTLSPVTRALLLVFRNWGPPRFRAIDVFLAMVSMRRRPRSFSGAFDGIGGHRSLDGRSVWGRHRVADQPLSGVHRWFAVHVVRFRARSLPISPILKQFFFCFRRPYSEKDV